MGFSVINPSTSPFVCFAHFVVEKTLESVHASDVVPWRVMVADQVQQEGEGV